MAEERTDIEKKIFRTLRSLSVILSVYVVGWFGFHWVWVFGSFMFYVFWKKTNRHDEKKRIFEGMSHDEAAMLLQYKDLPSWVCFPDVQRAEWINRILDQMWPFISDMVSTILKENVEPEIKKHMPSLLKSFHFLEVDLGNQPIRLGGIKVYTEHVKPNEILIDAEVIYAGDAIVQVGFSPGITTGISDLQIRGTMRIELRPILPKSPLVGAVTVYFLDNPEIDFDLTNLLNFFDITGLDSILKSIVDKVVESFIVLPQRLTIPIANKEDLQSLQYPMPLGVLRANILSATGLKAKDIKLFGKDSSDPFVKVKVGKFKYETKVIEDTLSPKWKDESFTIFIERVVGTKVQFDVFDKDSNSDPDFLGYTEKSLEQLFHGGEKNKDYVLPLDDNRGSLTCQLEWYNFTEDASIIRTHIKDKTATITCLFIKLEYAIGLPAIKMEDGTCSAYVELTVGDTTVISKTKRNTRKPIWNELHYFFVHDPENEVVTFKVKDESDDDLGYFKFKLSSLLQQEPVMKMSDAFTLKDCFTEAHLVATLELKGLVSNICEEQVKDT